jgi:hypothetical protein
MLDSVWRQAIFFLQIILNKASLNVISGNFWSWVRINGFNMVNTGRRVTSRGGWSTQNLGFSWLNTVKTMCKTISHKYIMTIWDNMSNILLNLNQFFEMFKPRKVKNLHIHDYYGIFYTLRLRNCTQVLCWFFQLIYE